MARNTPVRTSSGTNKTFLADKQTVSGMVQLRRRRLELHHQQTLPRPILDLRRRTRQHPRNDLYRWDEGERGSAFAGGEHSDIGGNRGGSEGDFIEGFWGEGGEYYSAGLV